MAEFKSWDGTGTLEFEMSAYGRDVLVDLVAELQTSDDGKDTYRIGWREKERLMRRSDGSTVSVAFPFLTIEMRQPGPKK